MSGLTPAVRGSPVNQRLRRTGTSVALALAPAAERQYRWALPAMRIDGENGWIELLRREDEEAFAVQCSVGDFAGRNPRIWIDANEQRRFLEALRALESDRRGEARVTAMSPDELELTIRVVDRLGHVSVAGMIGRIQYFGQSYERLGLKFSFTLDPTSLPKVLRDLVELLGAA